MVVDLPRQKLALANDPTVVETVMLDRAGNFPKSAVVYRTSDVPSSRSGGNRLPSVVEPLELRIERDQRVICDRTDRGAAGAAPGRAPRCRRTIRATPRFDPIRASRACPAGEAMDSRVPDSRREFHGLLGSSVADPLRNTLRDE